MTEYVAEYIDLKAGLDEIERFIGYLDDDMINRIQIAMKRLPKLNASRAAHGKWVWDKDAIDFGVGAWRCSECNTISSLLWNRDKDSPSHKSGKGFCPNCGAMMDGK